MNCVENSLYITGLFWLDGVGLRFSYLGGLCDMVQSMGNLCAYNCL